MLRGKGVNFMNNSLKLGVYRHFKGKLYELVAIAKHSETLEEMAVYRALYEGGGVWVRPLYMWDETVVHNGQSLKRFTYIGENKENL
jgi:hypothetical protein